MGIDTPVDSGGGGGGAGSLSIRDESNNQSGTVENIIAPDLSFSFAGTTAAFHPGPAYGASLNGVPIGEAVLGMGLPMDESSSPVIDKQRGYQLTEASGTPAYGETPKFGSGAIKLGRGFGCLIRRSTPYLAPNNTNFGAHTISFWGKPEAAISGQTGYYFSYYIGSTDRIYLFSDTTSIRFVSFNGSSVQANVLYTALTAKGINIFDGAFHMFTCTRKYDANGRTVKFYIDGIHVAEANDNTVLELYGTSTTKLNIAGQNDVASAAAICTFDEFLIFDGELSAYQIYQLYNGGTGVSIATPTRTLYGFTDGLLSPYNDLITNVWRMNGVGRVAVNDKGLAALQGYDPITREVAGRWPGSLATRFGGVTGSVSAHQSHFTRYNDFGGPDSNTPFAINFDIKINSTQVGSSGALFEVLTEMGVNNGRGSSNRQGLSIGAGPVLSTWNDFSGVTSGSIASIVGDGNFHTITWGQRFNGATKEIFVAIDGVISVASPTTWSDCSVEATSFNIGHSIEWYSGSINDRVGDFDIQNVVMWQDVNVTDAMIAALNGAELVAL